MRVILGSRKYTVRTANVWTCHDERRCGVEELGSEGVETKVDRIGRVGVDVPDVVYVSNGRWFTKNCYKM